MGEAGCQNPSSETVSEDFGTIRKRPRNQYLVEHKTANDGIAETRMKLGYSCISEAGKTRRKTRIYTTFTPIQIKTPKKRPKVVLKEAAFSFREICKLSNGDIKSKEVFL